MGSYLSFTGGDIWTLIYSTMVPVKSILMEIILVNQKALVLQMVN
jgi:hypothetical protein